ncbi:uncharacterized protein HaLaN_22715 [Haematococcus lacustris]|uniref:chorismate mutase n=1 Tax=Haematococcus lacustris TaxID=44745 RepID=A0A699ZYR0_HAELA|nr:uncharacterized protein HaLaN_22715 [Haematococcus lacustris]
MWHYVKLETELTHVYLQEVLPGITQPGDDNNYGSAGVLDVLCLQALSKRIHYGKFVAEAKFQAQPQEYERLIRARDAQAILHLLTDKAVEQRVIERVRLKAATFGQDIVAPSQQPGSSSASSNDSGSNGEGSSDSSDTHLPGLLPPQGLSSKEAAGPRLKVSPDVVAALYERWVMPLTKEVEVQYLLARLG